MSDYDEDFDNEFPSPPKKDAYQPNFATRTNNSRLENA
jgi:hypothetical protein